MTDQLAMQRQIAKELGVCPPFADEQALVRELERRIAFLKTSLKKAGAKVYVLGISGGVDSLTAGMMTQRAINELRAETGDNSYHFIAMRLPYKTQADEVEASQAVEVIAPDQCEVVNIAASVEAMVNAVDCLQQVAASKRDFIIGNIKARARMIAQYAVANANDGLVVGTLLNDYKEQGPCLVNCSTALLADFAKQPEQWPGFLVYSQQEAEKLITHFRTMLTVRFYEEEKGILNYLDKRVANFFFQMPQEQLNLWLGPVDALYWYGGDFIQTAKNQQYFQSVKNLLPLAERCPLAKEPLLTSEQTELLEACQQQQSIWEWSINLNTPFTDAWQSYQEANALAFTGDQIDQYMQLRRQYPHQQLPDKWPEQITTQEKLQQITTLWNTAN